MANYINEINGKGGIHAKMVADSVANGVRLTTLELMYPRFIHAEFMTHRVFSRNASSSRAIPIAKQIERVSAYPAHPVEWGRNQPGMQAGAEVMDPLEAEDEWDAASKRAVESAIHLEYIGLHKQIVNRVLEPFQFIHVIVTATEWENFFHLRLHPDAQPEIQELARVMKQSMDESEPHDVTVHLPYIKEEEYGEFGLDYLFDISSARCARVSYVNHDNSAADPQRDLELAKRLREAGHMSPFEHQATAMTELGDDAFYYLERYGKLPDGTTHIDGNYDVWSGNFKGWTQYRQTL